MAESKFISSFLPSEEILSTYTIKQRTQLPLVALTNVITCAIAFLAGVALIFQPTKIFSGICMIISSAIFVVAIILLKKSKRVLSAVFSSIGILTLCLITTFFLTFNNNPFVPYRVCSIMCLCAVINYLIADKRFQIILHSAIAITMFAIAAFTSFSEIWIIDKVETITAYSLCAIALCATNIFIFLIFSLNNKLNNDAAVARDNAEKSLDTIKKVLDESKVGFQIGQTLTNETDKALESTNVVTNHYEALESGAGTFTAEVKNVSDSSSLVLERAEKMKGSVQEQNAGITQTSASMTEISANLTNISGIAEKRRVAMNNMISTLDGQAGLLQKLVSDVKKVEESSLGIAGFVSTVDDIASQTGLLAMNASIEAAHAGAAGKGFSVIAQEIRKLSEETTKNAAQISDVLKLNKEVVNSSTISVGEFAVATKQSTEELRTTIQAIDEILSGISEMDIGARDVMKTLQSIVDESRTTTGLVDEVVSEISQQGSALVHITNFAGTLQNRVKELDNMLKTIKESMLIIKSEANNNSEVSAKISDVLSTI